MEVDETELESLDNPELSEIRGSLLSKMRLKIFRKGALWKAEQTREFVKTEERFLTEKIRTRFGMNGPRASGTRVRFSNTSNQIKKQNRKNSLTCCIINQTYQA